MNSGNVNSGNLNPDDIDSAGPDDSLVSRLAVIEGRPLESRAAAYVQLHDELRERLEGGDQPRSSNG